MSLVSFQYTIKREEYIGYYIVPSPVGNCQIFSLMNTCYILDEYSTNTRAKKEIIDAGISVGRIRQCLIDVKNVYCDRIDAMFKLNEIVFKQPYKSTNGSDMCMYLIKIPYGAY